jgi:antitoxin MazE
MDKNAGITTEIVRIGNSQGVRIPKAIREQAGLSGKVLMTVSGGAVVIRPAPKPRQGWDEAFARASKNRGGESIWPDAMRNEFDDAEWTW